MPQADLIRAIVAADRAASAGGHRLEPWRVLNGEAVTSRCTNVGCVLEPRVWAMDADRPRRYVGCPFTAAMLDSLLDG